MDKNQIKGEVESLFGAEFIPRVMMIVTGKLFPLEKLALEASRLQSKI